MVLFSQNFEGKFFKISRRGGGIPKIPGRGLPAISVALYKVRLTI